MATTGNINLKRIGRAATCTGLTLLIAAQPALAMTATTSEVTAHAEAATPKLSSEQRSDTVWATSDGQEFETQAEAQAHARSTVPTVSKGTKQVDVWLTSDGHEFGSQAEADAHADSLTPTVHKKTDTIHHEAVTETRYKTMWSSCSGSPYYKDGFATREEAELWWEQAGRQAEEDGYTGTLKGAIPYSVPYTVTVTPAYDEEVVTWLTSDGAIFSTETEAANHRDAMRPTVSPSTKAVPVWTTSDGKSFDAERDAYDYAESCALAVTSREETYTVWLAPYDQEFGSKEEAEGYIADLDALSAEGVAPFTDVSTSDWPFRWTVRAAARGLMSGYADTTLFGPNDLLTRCQVATVLWRAAGSPEPTSVKSYPDVEGGSYYEKAVAWCSEQGIVTGYTGGPSAGKFCPWSNVTREELATMAARWARSRGHELAIDQEVVNDLHIDDWGYVSGWAQDSITRTASSGILGGVDNGDGTHSLQPQGCATRAQAAKVFVALQDAAR